MSINSSLWETQLCLGLEGLRVVEDAYRHVDLASNHSSSGNRGSRSRPEAPHHEPAPRRPRTRPPYRVGSTSDRLRQDVGNGSLVAQRPHPCHHRIDRRRHDRAAAPLLPRVNVREVNLYFGYIHRL